MADFSCGRMCLCLPQFVLIFPAIFSAVAASLLAPYYLKRSSQVVNTFFKRQLLDTQHGTLCYSFHSTLCEKCCEVKRLLL